MPRPVLFALAWTLVALVALLLPGEIVPETSALSADKVVHVGLFALFGGLWLYAYPQALARVFVAGVVFGVLTEVLQGALPIGRSADPWDIVANLVGLVLGMGAAVLARRIQRAG